jgi:hypothetical protein
VPCVITLDCPDSLDCPDCRSAGSVVRDVCQVCLADLSDRCDLSNPEGCSDSSDGCDFPTATHRVAAQAGPPAVRELPHPAGPLRFTDVVGELRSIARLAVIAGAANPGSRDLAEACLRAELLVSALRDQFMADVVLPGGLPARHIA